jgi:hypothetical protein
MSRRVVDYDEDLPPIELELVPVDLRKLAAEAAADRYLFPCRCAGLELDAPVDFLDACPPDEQAWTLIGCRVGAEAGALEDQDVEVGVHPPGPGCGAQPGGHHQAPGSGHAGA